MQNVTTNPPEFCSIFPPLIWEISSKVPLFYFMIIRYESPSLTAGSRVHNLLHLNHIKLFETQ